MVIGTWLSNLEKEENAIKMWKYLEEKYLKGPRQWQQKKRLSRQMEVLLKNSKLTKLKKRVTSKKK